MLLSRKCISAIRMSLFGRLLRTLIPEDTERGCGYGLLKLPLDHPFNRACDLHDFDFGGAHKEGEAYEKSKDQTDFELAYRWMLIARAEPDPVRRCELIMDICKYWPLARYGGSLMWDGK